MKPLISPLCHTFNLPAHLYTLPPISSLSQSSLLNLHLPTSHPLDAVLLISLLSTFLSTYIITSSLATYLFIYVPEHIFMHVTVAVDF